MRSDRLPCCLVKLAQHSGAARVRMRTSFEQASSHWTARRLVSSKSQNKSKDHDHVLELDAGGQKYTYDPIFLRDACSCPRCVDPLTSQRLFATADIPTDIVVTSTVPQQNNSIRINWQNDIRGYDRHSSQFSFEFLRDYATHERRRAASRDQPVWKPWSRATLTSQLQTFEYSEYMNSNHVLYLLLKQLAVSGLAFLSQVPRDPAAVKSIANRIGPLRNSFYGETWDVRSDATAKNVAYTSRELGFHMDLLYMADPPKLQLLHVIDASALGGESLFSDSFNALIDLCKQSPALVASLAKFHTTYRYKNAGQWYQFDRPTVDVLRDVPGVMSADETSAFLQVNLQAVNWSPPFQGPLQDDIGDGPRDEHPTSLREHMRGISLFKKRLEHEDNIFETRMEEGTCVLFDNRRIVHARRAFENESGKRWLRGAYVDGDPLRSRLRVLHEG